MCIFIRQVNINYLTVTVTFLTNYYYYFILHIFVRFVHVAFMLYAESYENLQCELSELEKEYKAWGSTNYN